MIITNSKRLIWIGAGTATTPEFDFDNYVSVTLIEAREDACRELSALFRNSENVTVKHCCVSGTGEERKFFTCNVKEFSALALPADLKSLYPGLKVEAPLKIETISIDEIIEQEAEDLDLELFIDIPATAAEIIRKLYEGGIVERISKLYVTAGNELLYEESLSLADIKELLDGYFLTEAERDESDPDIPTVTFALDKNAKVIRQLKVENEKLKEQLQGVRQQEKRTAELVEDRNIKASLLIEKEQALDEANQKLERARNCHESEISKLGDEATALKKKINETDSVNVNLSKSLDITTKHNLKLQVDLDNLRERFANSQETEARLKALISDLHEKLQKAANFYHRLEKTNAELLNQSDE